MSEVKYTVKIEMLRVIAWAVVRDSDASAILLEPITLPLDPRENDGQSISVTEDNRLNTVIKPMDVMSVIPATNTMQSWLVLQANGQDIWQPNKVRVAHAGGFFTTGVSDFAEQLAWLESERQRMEQDMEQEFGYFFQMLEGQKRRAEREARGETVFP
jgi:hypothetical protein